MYNLLANIAAENSGHFNLILLFGLMIMCGTFGARLFQKLGIPQVVGCVVVGILLREVFGVITAETLETLKPFTMFVLGVIGFMIGSELRGDVFKKYGKQFFVILFAQGLGAFILVAAGTFAVMWFVTANMSLSIAVGLVLGAIGSATAPAATVNVLWEYKTRGPLTAAILAIVALDDALALLLYRVAATSAQAVMGTGHDSILTATLVLLGEIVGSLVLGVLAGVLLYYLLKFVREDDKILGFSVASLLLVVGISLIPDVDPILPAMTFGITIANMAARQSRNTFTLIEKFSPPIYTSFFVLAGAHMEFARMDLSIVAMIVAYVLCRAIGKIVGVWFGASRSGAPAVVKKYLGICLLPQAGVAIGLAILAGKQFNAELGKIIIMIVMAATFLMEIFGPMLVRVGVKRAGEVGMNVTEEDLIKTYSVSDVMDAEPTSIAQDRSLQEILEVFSSTDLVCYPVVDSESHLGGMITIANIKEMFANREFAGWLLACDVAEPVEDKTTPAVSLEDAMEYMSRYDLEVLPVVAAEDDDKLVGVLNYRRTLRKISAEVLNRRRISDKTALATG